MSVLVHVEHGKIPPVIDEHSVVLILGTMPSPKSREAGFYYAHPQNRFWPVLAEVFHEAVPQGTDERRAFALRHGIALWDVLAQCDIEGASDAAIKNPVPNDIALLLKNSKIHAVFAAGKRRGNLLRRNRPSLRLRVGKTYKSCRTVSASGARVRTYSSSRSSTAAISPAGCPVTPKTG